MIAVTGQAEPLPADTEARLEEFTELVATAISNIEARADLAASRARDRRHGGRGAPACGPRPARRGTAAAGPYGRHAQARAQGDGDGRRRVPALLTEAVDQAEQTTDEVRELAHGILPAVLSRADCVQVSSRWLRGCPCR